MAGDGYNPGDIFVDKLTLSSARGSLTLEKSFVSASIYESIFVPCMVADIVVLDTNDQLGRLKIVGGEKIEFQFKAPGGEQASYKFVLDSLDDVRASTGAQKSKQYILKCVSEEAFYDHHHVQKSFKSKQIDASIEDIVKNYLNSSKKVDKEETKGPQSPIAPHYNAFKAIDFLRRRAVSSNHKTGSYVFFETRDGGSQIFKFCTIEKLFEGSPIKEFVQSDTVGNDAKRQTDNNIMAYEVPKQLSTKDRLTYGGKQRVATFNTRTHQYDSKDTTPDPTTFKSGGNGGYDSSDFKNKYFHPEHPPLSIIPIDGSSGNRENTRIAESTAEQRSYLGLLMQNAMKIRVPGDAKLTVGNMVKANIPVKSGTTENKQNDTLLSGNFLITRLHHKIGGAAERPRYTCILELVKGSLEEGV